jgi:5'-3' exonuclease
MSEPTEILLIDLSSLAHPIFHMATDPSTVHVALVDRVRALASAHPHAAICCDSGKSFRADLDPTYKANRPESDAVLHHEIDVACDVLRGDGFPVWKVAGFEADDLIASATAQALAINDTEVLIVSADKDLLALIEPRVHAKSIRDGSILDEAAVMQKMGVAPVQVPDLLALLGDKSDNIKGANRIGQVKAVNLLLQHGTLEQVYAALDRGEVGPPSTITSLAEFRQRWPLVADLIRLRRDVEIPFHEIAVERTPTGEEPAMSYVDTEEAEAAMAAETVSEPVTPSAVGPRTATEIQPTPPPVEFERQLEPRSMAQAKELAMMMYQARLFSGYGSPQAVLSTVLAGRELGLQAIASLRSMHIVEGRHSPSADLLRALVLRSGKARYFRCTERTPDAATFETQRGDEPPTTLRYTMDDAVAAGLVKDKGSWKKHPADMLVARASSKLARLVYPDVCAGLYAPEEVQD